MMPTKLSLRNKTVNLFRCIRELGFRSGIKVWKIHVARFAGDFDCEGRIKQIQENAKMVVKYERNNDAAANVYMAHSRALESANPNFVQIDKALIQVRKIELMKHLYPELR